MIRRPPISTRTDTLFPYTTLFRSDGDRSHTRSGGQAVNPARVFLVDDHQMFRRGVRAELGDGVVVVGEAADVESAVAGIRATHPEVVLLDVHLPGGGGKIGRAHVSTPVTNAHPVCRLLLATTEHRT